MSAPHRKCCHLPVRGARKRAINGSPLAFRRSTAALAKALTPWLSFGPRFLELPGANGRTLPGASAASTSRTGHSAGRDDARSRPSAGLRAPPAGTALPSGRITDILNGRRSITADTAVRLGRYFGNSAQFWLDLQGQYDIAVVERERGVEITRRVRPADAA